MSLWGSQLRVLGYPRNVTVSSCCLCSLYGCKPAGQDRVPGETAKQAWQVPMHAWLPAAVHASSPHSAAPFPCAKASLCWHWW